MGEELLKKIAGGWRSLTITSVAVTGGFLPARIKNGTPFQRQELISSLSATKVQFASSAYTRLVTVAAKLAVLVRTEKNFQTNLSSIEIPATGLSTI